MVIFFYINKLIVLDMNIIFFNKKNVILEYVGRILCSKKKNNFFCILNKYLGFYVILFFVIYEWIIM